MFSHLAVAVYFIYVCLGLIFIGIAFLFYMKLRYLKAARRTELYKHKHQEYFRYLQASMGGSSPLPLPPGKLTRLERSVIQQKLMEWIGQMKGEFQTGLTELCREAGFIRRDLKLLDSLLYGRRIEAAFRLGAMRAEEAAPRLLDMLKQEKYSPQSIIVARAAAKCATEERQLREILGCLLASGKPIHHMAADIVLETKLDASKMLMGLLDDENPDFVKVGLVAMWGQAVPEAVPALNRLVGTGRRDVRAEAIKLYLSSGFALKDETIRQLMSDKDAEVRAEAAKSLGKLHAAGSIPLLQSALRDEDWRVRTSSAESLAQLGEAGFEALCAAALQGSGGERDAAFQQIERTIREGANAKGVEQMVAFNKKRLLYERYFGAPVIKPVRKAPAIGGDYSA
ncbi:HEAT repeat domain-containing protein [Paenibacillus caui]|uniref:HEAT repeat domain-containing protein n=1 Tax=Paenibacillus caui TaxID=2873927 RepID=UPI001CA94444|nr:HEAT repeat domain-containing protein [Paenibacillus caui]